MNLDKKLVVGIDVGGTNTEIGVIDNKGNILANTVFSTRCTENFNEFIQLISTNISHLIDELNLKKDNIKGVGIGAPNGNYYTGTVEFAPNLIWKGVLPFVHELKKHTGLNVVMTNDANAAAIGEGVFGGAVGKKHFAVITLGTGLGSGIVCDGKILYGHDGFAGELGHTIIDIDSNRLCGCGRKGCLETYVSATGIVKTAKEMLDNTYEESVLRNISPELLTSVDIAKAVMQHDLIASMSFDFTTKILAVALANYTAIASPEAIFITGGLAKAGDILFKPLISYYNEYVLSIFKGKTKILPSALNEQNVGLIGAAALAQNEF